MQVAQPAAQLLAHLGVQGAEGLVEQQHLRFQGQGAGQRHALLLAAGQLRRVAPGHGVHLHQFQQLTDPGAHRVAAGALTARQHAQPEGDVVGHGQVAEQRVLLEYEAHFAAAHVQGGDVALVEQHPAPVRFFQAGDDAQQGGLAGAGRAQQTHQLALGHVQGNVIQCGEAAERLADAVNADAHVRVSSAAFSLLLWRHSSTVFRSRVTSAMAPSRPAAVKAPTVL